MINIKTFPLDDIDYEASEIGLYLATRTRGIFADVNNFDVSSNNNMTINVSGGLAWLKWGNAWGVGVYLENTGMLTIEQADALYDRIDSVIIRGDRIQNKSYITILKGIPSTNSVAPAPVRDANYEDLVIAHVLVPSASISISQGNITSTKLDESLCGIMRDGVTGIPTAELQAQVDDLLVTLRQAIIDASRVKLLIDVNLVLENWVVDGGKFTQTVEVEGVNSTMQMQLLENRTDSMTLEEVKAYQKDYGKIAQGVNYTNNGSVTFNVYERPSATRLIGIVEV